MAPESKQESTDENTVNSMNLIQIITSDPSEIQGERARKAPETTKATMRSHESSGERTKHKTRVGGLGPERKQ